MAEQTNPRDPLNSDEVVANERVAQSREAWRRVGWRVRSITPSMMARFVLIAGTAAALLWLVVTAWPELVPFAAGALLAYAVLPLVNSLDRVLPRRLAALIVMLVTLSLLAAALALIVPVLARQVLRLVAVLPPAEAISQSIDQLDPALNTLPEMLREPVRFTLDETLVSLRQAITTGVNRLPTALSGALLRLLSIVGAVFGLLVLPVWLLAVLTDQREAAKAFKRILPSSIGPDLWAVLRIIDRAFRAFFQGQGTQGLAAGLLSYLAMLAFNQVSWLPQVEFPLVIALFVGLMELIPEIGPLVAVLVLGASAALASPQDGLVAVLAYLLIHWLAAKYMQSRTRRHVKALHPAVLIIGAVALSQLGWVWVLLSVPILTSARDLFRYAYGRLGAPPQPAGVIPDEQATAAVAAQQRKQRSKQRVPVTYRHR